MSVPRRKTNGTAPGRVACQSLKGETANEKQLRQGKEGILRMTEKQSFMRVDEVAQELGVSKSYAYKIVQKLNAELKSLGYLTISGRVNRKFFYEKLCYGEKERNSYSSDYDVIGKLKQFADKHGVCVLIVHHTRKQPAGDSFEMISGTTGLLGCADGALLMQKEKRTDGKATLDIVGRDQPDQRLYLTKDQEHLVWELERAENELWKQPPDPVLEAVSKMVSAENPDWEGSPTELAETLPTDMAVNRLTKHLNVNASRFFDFAFHYSKIRHHEGFPM